MKFFKYSALFLALFSSAATLTSCDDDDNVQPDATNLILEFDNVVGSSDLILSSPTNYQTAAGDQFSVTTLRYYISNIKLKKADGTEYAEPESYHLVDEELPASQALALSNVPAGDYTSLTFTVGVDSARNVAGAQTGALTPSNMFWSWNSGYIYTKLEGRSPQSPTSAIIFHIGGFKSPNNTIRTVTPTLNGATIQVREGRTPEVHIKADVLKMFTGPNTIRFASTNEVMGGANAVLVANNQAAGMFTVDHIHGN